MFCAILSQTDRTFEHFQSQWNNVPFSSEYLHQIYGMSGQILFDFTGEIYEFALVIHVAIISVLYILYSVVHLSIPFPNMLHRIRILDPF